jgi:hypothetical protein
MLDDQILAVIRHRARAGRGRDRAGVTGTAGNPRKKSAGTGQQFGEDLRRGVVFEQGR